MSLKDTKNMLEVKELRKRFGKTSIINGVSFGVRESERHAVIGPNGAGKTTLFHLITGNYSLDSGKIVFNGRDISGMPPHKINRMGLARSFQVTNVFPGLSVLENVRAVVLSRRQIRFNFFRNVWRMAEINQESIMVLEKIGLQDKKDVPAGELAYGEQRALEIGLTLASEPKMILLDEPTAGMSMDETREAVKLIEKLSMGKTMLIIEHDMEVVFRLADIITVINYGEVLASGQPDEIRGNEKVKRAYLGDH